MLGCTLRHFHQILYGFISGFSEKNELCDYYREKAELLYTAHVFTVIVILYTKLISPYQVYITNANPS